MVIKMRQLEVATYNVRVDTEADKEWAWDYRKEQVIDLIKYHDWDVFGIQEIRPNQVEDLSVLTAYESFTQEREGDQTGEGLGIYYKKDLFTCVEKGYFWLSDTPDIPSIHEEAGCKRLCLWQVLHCPTSNHTFLVINTHLDHISDIARKEGMLVLLSRLKEKISMYPTLLLGDFNCEREEVIHKELEKTFLYPEDQTDVFLYGPKGTFQDFDYFREWKDLEHIDYILYKGMSCLKQGVLTDSCNLKYPSDHFPVVATFNFLS